MSLHVLSEKPRLGAKNIVRRRRLRNGFACRWRIRRNANISVQFASGVRFVGNDPLNFADPTGLFGARVSGASALFRSENVVSVTGSAGLQIGLGATAGAIKYGAEFNLGSYERSSAYEGRRVTQSFGAFIEFSGLGREAVTANRSAAVSSAPNLISDFGRSINGAPYDTVTDLFPKGLRTSQRVKNDMIEDIRIGVDVKAFLGLNAEVNLSAFARAAGGATYILINGQP